MRIPKQYKDLVGKTYSFSGGLFSRKKDLPPKEYRVLDIRFGSGTIVNVKELLETGESSYEHPTFELLLKNDDMKKAQWSRSFPIREIDFKKLNKKPSAQESDTTNDK